jgi:hypothetical protein
LEGVSAAHVVLSKGDRKGRGKGQGRVGRRDCREKAYSTRCKVPGTKEFPMAVLLKVLLKAALGVAYLSRMAAYEGMISGSWFCSSFWFSGVGRGLACVRERKMVRSRPSMMENFIVDIVFVLGVVLGNRE